MTEQEFQTQVWRMYDRITTAEGVPGKVLGVNFTTKSVRAFISGAPEWVRCDLIETHTSGSGKACDDAVIIEELHNKVLNQADEINRLINERKGLIKKEEKDYNKDLWTAVHLLRQGIQEKKTKMDKIDAALSLIAKIVEKKGFPDHDLPAGNEV